MSKQTEIVCIIDKSGSMCTVRDDSIGGFNTFLKEQKRLKDKATMTLVLFDTSFTTIYENEPINKVKQLNEKIYVPGGCTALLDAIGSTLVNVAKRYDGKKTKNQKVIVVILTDGQENSSREYKKQQIKDMISTHQEKQKWEFIFLGANQDAFAEADGIGFQARNTANYLHTGIGTQNAYMNISTAVSNFRNTGDTGDWKKDDVSAKK